MDLGLSMSYHFFFFFFFDNKRGEKIEIERNAVVMDFIYLL